MLRIWTFDVNDRKNEMRMSAIFILLWSFKHGLEEKNDQEELKAGMLASSTSHPNSSSLCFRFSKCAMRVITFFSLSPYLFLSFCTSCKAQTSLKWDVIHAVNISKVAEIKLLPFYGSQIIRRMRISSIELKS